MGLVYETITGAYNLWSISATLKNGCGLQDYYFLVLLSGV